ncbi:hypothetical protein LTR78_010450 [Recurvomyces mirabilis]|uniref:DUF1772-domain-containing protein n=1 Tax=Recurvomyces mirabilis TaxID=574656 RepID=A0AAE0WI88_9PEZI|nr:hypothetical protein LTR78_010450 [Recurvomyces mirabilis]KAK5150529.1 hypothetical protein LTS14_010022 [Recurvomyces mirabilis]
MSNLMSQGTFYTTDMGTPLRIAQVLGLTTSAFLAGKTFAVSFGTVPALLHAPVPLLAKQIDDVFQADLIINPVLVALGTGVFGYFAYRDPNRGSPAHILYTTSSILLASVFPYSLLFLHPITEKLTRKAHSLSCASLTDTAIESGVAKEETTHALVDKWATVNLGRTVLSTLAAVTATWAAVDRLEVVPAAVRLGGGAGRMGK